MTDVDPRDCPHEAAYTEVTGIAPPQDCLHETAYTKATIGAQDGAAWDVLAPEEWQGGAPGLRARVSLGVCATCSASVASICTWDADEWTRENRPTSTSRWTRLVLDGGQ